MTSTRSLAFESSCLCDLNVKDVRDVCWRGLKGGAAQSLDARLRHCALVHHEYECPVRGRTSPASAYSQRGIHWLRSSDGCCTKHTAAHNSGTIPAAAQHHSGPAIATAAVILPPLFTPAHPLYSTLQPPSLNIRLIARHRVVSTTRLSSVLSQPVFFAQPRSTMFLASARVASPLFLALLTSLLPLSRLAAIPTGVQSMSGLGQLGGVAFDLAGYIYVTSGAPGWSVLMKLSADGLRVRQRWMCRAVHTAPLMPTVCVSLQACSNSTAAK